MQRWWTLTAPLWLALSLLAQDGSRGAVPAPAPVPAFDKFTADYKVETDRYQAAVRELTATDEYKQAVKDRDSEKLTALRQKLTPVDRATFVARAEAEAKARSGQDEAVPFLCWIASAGGDKPAAERAVEALLQSHTKSPRLADFVESSAVVASQIGMPAYRAMLDKIAAESPFAAVNAWAKYQVAQSLSRDKAASEADKARVEVLLKEAAALAAGTDLELRINAPTFEKERLQIGMVAPEIEGVDTDGTAFKLSDYRGKVVVLDFWGFW